MVMNLALVFLVLFALLLQNAEAANCTTLSHSFEAKLNNTCASVVDYSFYLPDGVTLDDLAAMANSQLNNTNLKTFPPLCQQAVRDLVCSNVYLKCYPGIDLALRGTYNFHIYPNMATPPAANSRFPVPFVRPCESTCKNVKLQCAGLYHVGHSFPHCNGTFDYSYGAYTGIDPVPRQYDNDTTQCFKVANVSVASNSEVYQYRHGGVCAGIVNQIFIPPGSAVQPYYSVLQEPYAVQRVIEETLATRTSVLPGWLQSECRLAMLRYICGSAYLVPQGILFNSRLRAAGIPATFAPTLERNYPGLWNYTMILPSFPSLKTCTDYGKTCASFLAFANNSNIEPDCDAESPLIPGVKKFPNATQLLVRQYAQALNVYVSFYTDPHNMSYYNTSEYAYTPSCPYGYVYPEHPNSSHTQYVGVTGCALACRPRVWTDKEWKFLDDRASQLPAAGLVLSILLMLTFYFRINELRSNYLMMLFTVLAFVVSAASVALHQKPTRKQGSSSRTSRLSKFLDRNTSNLNDGTVDEGKASLATAVARYDSRMGRRPLADNEKKKRAAKKRSLESDDQKSSSKKSDVDEEYVEDVFDRTRMIDLKTDYCAFCKQGHDFGVLLASKCKCPDDEEDMEIAANLALADSILDVEMVWASRYSLNQKSRKFFHYYCALFSPRVWFKGDGWCNIGKEMSRGNMLKCGFCNKSGATLGCSDKRCKITSHIPCAVQQGYQVTRYKNEFLCSEHDPMSQVYQRNNPKPPHITAWEDLSRGAEPYPIAVVLPTDSTVATDPLLGGESSSSGKMSKVTLAALKDPIFTTFEYVKDIVDSAEVTMNLRSIENVLCCNCTGLCYDVNECACLAGGKSYSFNGYLVPGVNNVIVECNFMCNCSYRRCTNRVVEKGLCFQLQIMPARTIHGTTVWGVRTLEDIPANAFITIIGGQMVTTESVGKVAHRPGAQLDGRTVLEVLLSDGNNKANKHNRIIPLGMWEDTDFGTVVDWAKAKVAATTTGTSDELTTDQAVREFLKGQLDCRYFGNVGAFIRRRSKHNEEKMLTRRLVYFNQNNKKYARLALFAAVNIPAGTELRI